MKNSNDKLNKTYIKDVLKKYLKTKDPEDFINMLINISRRIREDGTVPAPLKTETRIAIGFDPALEVEDIFPLDDRPVYTSRLITGDDGDRWLPLFTDISELGNPGKSEIIIDRPIFDIIYEAFHDDSINGVVIDPYSDALSISKELLYVILNLLEDEDSEAG